MRGTGRRLFRQHAGHQLTGGVEIERAFDTDEVIIGGAEREPAAPDDAAAFRFDHPAQRGGVQGDWRHDLHRVGRPRRRGDRTARRLGDQIPRRRDDGDDDRRRPVARQSADAVFVENGPVPPVERLPGILHGAGQRHGLDLVQPVARTGGNECGKLEIRKPIVEGVADDSCETGLIQSFAIGFRPDHRRGSGRFRVRERGPVPRLRFKGRPGGN